MKTYTVNEIRTTLHPIMQNIFSTSFTFKYEHNIAKYEKNLDYIMDEEASKADHAICDMAQFLDSPSALDTIVTKLSAKIICTIYIRYYWLSSFLMKINQADVVELPEDRQMFFIYLLTEYWKLAINS